VDYDYSLSSDRLARNGRVFVGDHGDSLTRWIRVRVRSRRGAPGELETYVDVRPPASIDAAAAAPAAIVAGMAGLALPPAGGGDWFASQRGNRAWPWRYDRMRVAGRDVALEVDALAAADSAPARVCRLVEIAPFAGITSDRCRIEAIVDAADGWPLAALVVRTLQASDGSRAQESLTFRRLQPSSGNRP
jgi:hypothetical protein